ncbi:hypothetical protein [Sphingomonas faeni]|uniref:hypothetical protein n=1 Tax=Sphingomonas faeni TaxID=185950 RepID=UPI0020C7C142|nr:hypothetical protein [Sphingomonas faeni]MCP8890403.1 hypothetical protein [Sphingomonas faeni]
MTRRDLRWKAGGFALTAVSCAICVGREGSPLTIVLFLLALLGLPLMIYGKRVGQMFRAERRGHSHTVDVVHAARVRRRGQGTDGFGR